MATKDLSEPRHKITLLGLSRVSCKCGWTYHQPILKDDKPVKLQDKLLDSYNTHIQNRKEVGKDK